jgi:uncharacterized membrane protein YfcA
MTDETPEDRARARHMKLTLLSFGAAFMAASGAWMLSGRAPAEVPDELGYVVLILAIVIFFFGPNWLRKKWRAEDEHGQ